MDFKLIEANFVKNYTTKYVYTEYNTYQIKWAFEDFEKLLLKPTFQANISVNLDFQLSHDLISQIDQEIDQLRSLFMNISTSLQKYLAETKDEDFQRKTYQDFLNNFYKGFKEFVSNFFIPWIFANVKHEAIRVANYFYQPATYLKYGYEKFEYKLMQKMRLYLKAINNKIPEDQVFPILLKAYDEKLTEKQKDVQKLKTKSII